MNIQGLEQLSGTSNTFQIFLQQNRSAHLVNVAFVASILLFHASVDHGANG